MGKTIKLLILSFSVLGFCSSTIAGAEPQAPSSSDVDLKSIFLFASAIGACLAFIFSQVVIPVYKYKHGQERSRKMLLAIMASSVDKTYDFFGENYNTPFNEKMIFRLNEQLEMVLADKSYRLYLKVTSDRETFDRIFNEADFWFLPKNIRDAYMKYVGNATQSASMGEALMDKTFLDRISSAENGNERYARAIQSVIKQLEIWLESTKELNRELKEYSSTIRTE